MRRYLALTAVATLLLSVAACSSSEKREGESGDPQAAAEAGTDALPTDSAENPQLAQAGDAGAQQADAAGGQGPQGEGGGGAAPIQRSGQFENYTVNAGDTLMKVAFEVYGDLYQWRRIHEANRDQVQDPNRLAKGMVIKVEKPASPTQIDRNGEQYLIRKGDTLGTISGQVYGTQSKWRKLWENNRQLIKDPNRIFAGFTLYYVPEPGGASPLATGAGTPTPEANAGAPTDRNPSSVKAPTPLAPKGK